MSAVSKQYMMSLLNLDQAIWNQPGSIRKISEDSITKSHSFSLGPSDPHSQLKKENLGCFGGMQRGPTMQMASPRKKRNTFLEDSHVTILFKFQVFFF